jgi:hypothetical protein
MVKPPVKGPGLRIGTSKPGLRIGAAGKQPGKVSEKGKAQAKSELRPALRTVTNKHLDIVKYVVEEGIKNLEVPQDKIKRIQIGKELFIRLLKNPKINTIITNVDKDLPIYNLIRIILARKLGLIPKDLMN